MTIEVDQSVKIEAGGDTALAWARLGTSQSFTTRVRAEVKESCFCELRKRGYTDREIGVRMFAAVLFLLLEARWGEDERIVIDREYDGHEPEIASMLLQWIRPQWPGYDRRNITFAEVGKNSPAHHRALAVTRKQARPDQELSTKRILALL